MKALRCCILDANDGSRLTIGNSPGDVRACAVADRQYSDGKDAGQTERDREKNWTGRHVRRTGA